MIVPEKIQNLQESDFTRIEIDCNHFNMIATIREKDEEEKNANVIIYCNEIFKSHVTQISQSNTGKM